MAKFIDFSPFGFSSRSCSSRRSIARRRLENVKDIAITPDYLQYGYDYFDNPDLQIGYGAYKPIDSTATAASNLISLFSLTQGSSILEIGCAKGFLVHQFRLLGMNAFGIDQSAYAIANAPGDVRPFLRELNVENSSFADVFQDIHYDLIISKDVFPHFDLDFLVEFLCCCASQSKHQYYEIHTFTDPSDRDLYCAWDPTQKIIMNSHEWRSFFQSYPIEPTVFLKSII